MTTFLWNHTARLGGALNKKSVCRKKRDRKSFSSGEQKKDEMLISGGERSAADSCFIMLLADTNMLLQSPSQRASAGGRLALRSERRYLSSLKKKTFTICQQIEERGRLWLCELESTATFNPERVYSTSGTRGTSERSEKGNLHAAPSWLLTSTVRSPGGFLWHKQREHVNTSSGCPRGTLGQPRAQ